MIRNISAKLNSTLERNCLASPVWTDNPSRNHHVPETERASRLATCLVICLQGIYISSCVFDVSEVHAASSFRSQLCRVGEFHCIYRFCFEQLDPGYLGRYSDRRNTRRPGFDIPRGASYFSLPDSIKTSSGAYPASYPIPGVRRPTREANHWPLFRAGLKNGGAIPPLLHMSSWRVIKHRDNLTSTTVQ
jgi:hypothetical protein